MTKLYTAFVTALFFSIIGHIGYMTSYGQSNSNIGRLFSVEDVCAKSLTTISSIISMGDPFYSALQTYLNQDPLLAKKQSQLKTYLSEFAIHDLDDLVIRFGSDAIEKAIQRFPPSSLLNLLHSYGEEFFMVVLHNIAATQDQLSIINEFFKLDSKQFVDTVIRARGRFNGAMILLEDIDIHSFAAITNVFAKSLPSGVFLQKFYEDPYLLTSVIRIISKRDADGVFFNEFMELFPDSNIRAELFSKDLPGLVVAFSTIQEATSGKNILWVNELLDVSDNELAQLISNKPVDIAYIIHGGHSIGDENLKKLIASIGKEHFQLLLVEQTVWLADFLTGLNKISYFSSTFDLSESIKSKTYIEKKHSHLLNYNSYLPFNHDQVTDLFDRLPNAADFLKSDDKARQTRVYLLGLLSVYQHILYSHIPQSMLNLSQFELLKIQILYSTRFSKDLNNMISNFEVGNLMVKDRSMESIILFLAHELSHQIYSVIGFTSPLLSTAGIHECNSDIGARCIAQHVGYSAGITEYEYFVFNQDDYSKSVNIMETDLINLRDPHKIGRTQLGYIMRGFKNSNVTIDWEIFYAVSLSVLRNKSKMKNFHFIKKIVGGYMYCSLNRSVSYEALLDFIETFEKSYDVTSNSSEPQIANSSNVERMIQVANDLLLGSATH